MGRNQTTSVEHSSIITECMCGATMRLHMVEPHFLEAREIDIWVFACTECFHQLRVIRPRDVHPKA
jgi:hypothetical protein